MNNGHRHLEDNYLCSPVLTSSRPLENPLPANSQIPPGHERLWSRSRGAAVQTEPSANSPTLVHIVKKFLFTTYSWESGKGPHGPGLALT